ncbi:NADPH-dependent FMN reductase [Cellulomonas fimi]|uniref:NADPH-dependent FMN reductase n=1 Tax=Cellulomonas fimi (strain ATCC 484 / DSM 20113 / JCM 1341 / CCUG 24087 / LMG 16345 / NBRC 15513 / NCIMB 8980 / NCTC 7547 / NRS-133) TaxID=590998 RepID=F4H2F4_CELFA|nr:NAD(P)H-dependent oxidoreductase [Cellulomonas fimi]AEE47574.1 NADPH-dependent FMN reductase [Cellulomonas fimi ATCC 484]NNH09185.1 NAD(P)H-dependent oxidoreductase [Cellulomonas fimi]VEH36564.1 FMN reductase (NADPH) [Cellulomonas fimi]
MSHLVPVVALVGNPRPASRTRSTAERVAARVLPHVGADPGTPTSAVTTVDLAALAPQLFAAEHPDVDAALRTVAGAGVLVVATPVYKASYTGLLKAFLDGYGPDALAGVVAVPLVVSGSPAHTLVGEAYLRPLLVELGATVPTRALAVTEAELADLDTVVDRWLERAAEPLRRALHGTAALAGALR